MKTNRDILMGQFQTASTEDFITLQWTGKCTRCSNHYWDGAQNKCHKNINDSSCELGYKEWLESYPEENLQEKYNKKYWHFKDQACARLEKELMEQLYVSGTITSPLETETICKTCYNRKSCTGTNCYMYYQHLLNLYKNYIRELAEKDVDDKYPECDESIRDNYIAIYLKTQERDLTFEKFISEILIPRIIDTTTRRKAEQIIAELMTR